MNIDLSVLKFPICLRPHQVKSPVSERSPKLSNVETGLSFRLAFGNIRSCRLGCVRGVMDNS